MNINKLLKFSSDAGKLMLQSGGETYRVEETVSRICQSFDVDEVEVFASPTAVMISISFNGEINDLPIVPIIHIMPSRKCWFRRNKQR